MSNAIIQNLEDIEDFLNDVRMELESKLHFVDVDQIMRVKLVVKINSKIPMKRTAIIKRAVGLLMEIPAPKPQKEVKSESLNWRNVETQVPEVQFYSMTSPSFNSTSVMVNDVPITMSKDSDDLMGYRILQQSMATQTDSLVDVREIHSLRSQIETLESELKKKNIEFKEPKLEQKEDKNLNRPISNADSSILRILSERFFIDKRRIADKMNQLKEEIKSQNEQFNMVVTENKKIKAQLEKVLKQLPTIPDLELRLKQDEEINTMVKLIRSRDTSIAKLKSVLSDLQVYFRQTNNARLLQVCLDAFKF